MEKLPFNKVALLENLKIENRNEITNIKLVNKNVKILISILGGVIYLVGFYKQSLDGKRGIVRCALYVLLEKLLAEGKIQKQQIMKVSAPTPDDGNIERLIKIYTDIGFKKGRPEPGNPINLYNTVVELIKTLTAQCEISGGRKRRKKSRKSKRRKSRKKSKRKSRKKSKKRRKSRKKRKY